MDIDMDSADDNGDSSVSGIILYQAGVEADPAITTPQLPPSYNELMTSLHRLKQEQDGWKVKEMALNQRILELETECERMKAEGLQLQQPKLRVKPNMHLSKTSCRMRPQKDFSTLPIELRLMVWRETVVPRLVFYPEADWKPMEKFDLWYRLHTQPGFENVPSPNSNANRNALAPFASSEEARLEVGHGYRQMFASCRRSWTRSTSRLVDSVMFNPAIDTLVLNFHSQDLKFCKVADVEEVRYVVMSDGHSKIRSKPTPPLRLFTLLGHRLQDIEHVFRDCPKLERVTLFFDDTWAVQHAAECDEALYRSKYEGYIAEHMDRRILHLYRREHRLPSCPQEVKALRKRWREVVQVQFFANC